MESQTTTKKSGGWARALLPSEEKKGHSLYELKSQIKNTGLMLFLIDILIISNVTLLALGLIYFVAFR